MPSVLEEVLARFSERRRSRVRDARLWSKESPEGCEIETGLGHPTTEKLSLTVPDSKKGTHLLLGQQ